MVMSGIKCTFLSYPYELNKECLSNSLCIHHTIFHYFWIALTCFHSLCPVKSYQFQALIN